MASSAPPPPFRKVLEERFAGLSRELVELAAAHAADGARQARRETADRLNRSVRLMRQAESATEIASALLDASRGFAATAALFRISDGEAAGETIRGASPEDSDAFRSLRIPLADAPALAAAVETLDPVVSVSSAAEISAPLAALTGGAAEERIFLLPLAPEDRATALLCAWGDVDAPALELLAQAAAAFWRWIAPAATELVTLTPAPDVAAPASAWDALSSEDRRVHLSAQRFARVRAAEILLAHGAAIRHARSRRNVYDAVREPIDAARATFRASFMNACPSMVDYLHLELVRTLADDKAELLGEDYPGILV
jgi:hypothetical protein